MSEKRQFRTPSKTLPLFPSVFVTFDEHLPAGTRANSGTEPTFEQAPSISKESLVTEGAWFLSLSVSTTPGYAGECKKALASSIERSENRSTTLLLSRKLILDK